MRLEKRKKTHPGDIRGRNSFVTTNQRPSVRLCGKSIFPLLFLRLSSVLVLRPCLVRYRSHLLEKKIKKFKNINFVQRSMTVLRFSAQMSSFSKSPNRFRCRRFSCTHFISVIFRILPGST